MSTCKKYSCSECGKEYNYNKNLRQHVSKAHSDKLSEIAPLLKCQKSYTYQCGSCDKNFNHEYNLKRHTKEFHGTGFLVKNKLKCVLCVFETNAEKNLFEHFETTHNVPVKSEDLQLTSFESFLKWKEQTEQETLSRYVKKRGSHSSANKTVRHYYICHRSGHFTSESKGIRHVKLQGSNKINGVCPASMQVIQYDGLCKIRYISTHIGHQNDLSHLGLTVEERRRLATDIANKIPFQSILDKIRDSVSDSKLERIHLLTKQDLYNIEQSYNLSSTSVRHKNDGTSVEAWVNEVTSSDSNCVLFYKPQDSVNDMYPSLKSDDFVLIIMNNAQCEILKKYGNDCVCIDGTHGLNSYGFELTTLLVLDSMRQGFPCAFLISNRSDQQIMSIFFDHIRVAAGQIFPGVFMSDLAETYFNAWVLTMGDPKLRLFCTWHVDRAWRKNINSKVKGKEKQAEVYKIVRTLMQERDALAFESMLPNAMKQFNDDPETAEFGTYFRENYTKNVKSWAYCYRINSGLNTNMHIERMHHTLKYIYLHGKNVKRLDKAIFALMAFVKDKLFDRLIVMTKGKLTSKLKDIRHRHKTSLEVRKELIVKDESGWTIPSCSNVKELYFVQENEVQCNCKLLCTECNTCIHKYSCTCLDSSIKWNMCKHIHSICQLRIDQEDFTHVSSQENNDSGDDLFVHIEDCDNINEREEILAQVSKNENLSALSSITKQKETIRDELNDTINEISSARELEVLKRHVASLKATLSAVRSQTGNELANKCDSMSQKRKIVPQRRLFSTKKKKVNQPNIVRKPDETEVQDIAVSLLYQK